MLAKWQWKIQQLQKVILSIVNSEAMYEVQLTQVTLKPSSFLMVNMANSHEKPEFKLNPQKDIYSPYEKFPITQIPIEMTGNAHRNSPSNSNNMTLRPHM